jgi:hypothetical protein
VDPRLVVDETQRQKNLYLLYEFSQKFISVISLSVNEMTPYVLRYSEFVVVNSGTVVEVKEPQSPHLKLII